MFRFYVRPSFCLYVFVCRESPRCVTHVGGMELQTGRLPTFRYVLLPLWAVYVALLLPDRRYPSRQLRATALHVIFSVLPDIFTATYPPEVEVRNEMAGSLFWPVGRCHARERAAPAALPRRCYASPPSFSCVPPSRLRHSWYHLLCPIYAARCLSQRLPSQYAC